MTPLDRRTLLALLDAAITELTATQPRNIVDQVANARHLITERLPEGDQ